MELAKLKNNFRNTEYLRGRNDRIPKGEEMNKLTLKLMPKDYDINLLKRDSKGQYILPSLEELETYRWKKHNEKIKKELAEARANGENIPLCKWG